jgi:hypothetical protein
MSKTVNELISELEKIKNEGKGHLKVIYDKNGCWNGPREITEVKKTGYIFESLGDHDELSWIEDIDPNPTDQITEIIVLYSDREEFNPN